MYTIFTTLKKILSIKGKTESTDYLKGYGDCFELLKIGFEKSEHINLKLENNRLKNSLCKLLDFEFELNSHWVYNMKQIIEKNTNEYMVVSEILDNTLKNPHVVHKPDAFEEKMQNFMLKEIIFTLIRHKFDLSGKHIAHLLGILESGKTNDAKTNEIIQYLLRIEKDYKGTDQPRDMAKNDKLAEGADNSKVQVDILIQIISLLVSNEVGPKDKAHFKSLLLNGPGLDSFIKAYAYLDSLATIKNKEKWGENLSSKHKINIMKMVEEGYVPQHEFNKIFKYVSSLMKKSQAL